MHEAGVEEGTVYHGTGELKETGDHYAGRAHVIAGNWIGPKAQKA